MSRVISTDELLECPGVQGLVLLGHNAMDEINILRTKLAACEAQNELFQSALLKVRVALNLDIHSHDDLLEVIAVIGADARRWRAVRTLYPAALHRRFIDHSGRYSSVTGHAVLDKWADDAIKEIESLTGAK